MRRSASKKLKMKTGGKENIRSRGELLGHRVVVRYGRVAAFRTLSGTGMIT